MGFLIHTMTLKAWHLESFLLENELSDYLELLKQTKRSWKIPPCVFTESGTEISICESDFVEF